MLTKKPLKRDSLRAKIAVSQTPRPVAGNTTPAVRGGAKG